MMQGQGRGKRPWRFKELIDNKLIVCCAKVSFIISSTVFNGSNRKQLKIKRAGSEAACKMGICIVLFPKIF